MTNIEARAAIAATLADIAPEADLDIVDPTANLRAELDLDSLDFLGLVEGIADRTGVVVPERHYGQLISLNDWTSYLTTHAATTAPS